MGMGCVYCENSPREAGGWVSGSALRAEVNT